MFDPEEKTLVALVHVGVTPRAVIRLPGTLPEGVSIQPPETLAGGAGLQTGDLATRVGDSSTYELIAPAAGEQRHLTFGLTYAPRFGIASNRIPIDIDAGSLRYREWIEPLFGDQQISVTLQFSEPDTGLQFCGPCRRVVRGSCPVHGKG
jgi:hypothetical protein